MAKRKRIIDIAKAIKKGVGSGRGYNYIPWIKIQDVPSKGRSSMIKGIKTGRQHELLSDMERDYFYILDYSDKVKDIREQFPLLPLEDTELIAKELGVEHPRHPITGELIVMTTDFLVSISFNNESYEIARTIKSKDDLLNRRISEKFEIERIYWEKRGVNWSIATEEEIDRVVARNISSVHTLIDIRTRDSFIGIEESELQDIIREFIKKTIDNEKSMRTICTEFDEEMLLKKGSSLCIFKYLVINRIIEIDITQKINVNKNISSIRITEKSVKRIEVI